MGELGDEMKGSSFKRLKRVESMSAADIKEPYFTFQEKARCQRHKIGYPRIQKTFRYQVLYPDVLGLSEPGDYGKLLP